MNEKLISTLYFIDLFKPAGNRILPGNGLITNATLGQPFFFFRIYKDCISEDVRLPVSERIPKKENTQEIQTNMESTKGPIFENLAVQKGSWILVTGVNGYIASHIANQLLQLGYSVRGTVRDQSKSKWIKELFEAKYENCNFELAQVEDAVCSGAFDNAIQGRLPTP